MPTVISQKEKHSHASGSMEFRPTAHERGLRFGLIWSAAGCSLAILGLVGCSYIIPPDNRPPRHNQVVGDRRLPQLNSVTGQPPAQNYAPQQQQGYAAPVPNYAAPPQAPAPYDSQPPANTPSNFVTQLPPQAAAPRPLAMPPQKTWWQRNFNWLPGVDEPPDYSQTPLGQPLPAGSQLNIPASEPVVETGANAGDSLGTPSQYPALQDTPPAPTDGDATRARMQQGAQQLQGQQRDASAARDALTAQAASEPSLLQQYNTGNVPAAPLQAPAAEPVTGAAPAPVEGAGTPSFDETIATPIAPEAPQVAAPAPPPEPQPIILRPPSEEVAAPAEGGTSPKVINVGEVVDSMTIRQPAETSSGGHYLPESRYKRQHVPAE